MSTKVIPQEIIRELVKVVATPCAVCRKFSTREGEPQLLLVGSAKQFFCDAHSFADIPRYESFRARYSELKEAQILRKADKWLKENKI